MSRTADISFPADAPEAAEQFFVALIGWDMVVVPEPDYDLDPFTGHLISVGVSDRDGHIKGLWKPIDGSGNHIPDKPPIELDIYDELDRVEVL